MEKAKLDVLKGMSREARSEYFQKNKSDFLDSLLDSVNGGATRAGGKENPNSEEVPYNGNWVSSFGYVCDGETIC